MRKPKILISLPTKHHVEIAMDEVEGLQKLGYDVETFPYAAKEGYDSKLRKLQVIIENAVRLVKAASVFKPDIIYFNSRVEVIAGIRDFITLMIFKSFSREKPLFLLKSHGSDLEIFRSSSFFLKRIVLPFLKNNIHAWLFLSREEEEIVKRDRYFDESPVFVTKNIVRNNQFTPDPAFRERMGIPPNHKLLLFVGRILREKGIYEVVRAFSRIYRLYPSALIIVGSGEELENVKKLCSDLKLSEKVIFTGFIPESQVVRYHANCDVLIFPTYANEGFPMSLFNSVAAGMAVITTPVRAARDYLSEPENCLWVEQENSDKVFDALLALFSSEKVIANMKENNVQLGATFNQEQVCRELGEIITTTMEIYGVDPTD